MGKFSDTVKALFEKFRNLILYGIFGAAAAVIDYAVYSLLMYFKITATPEFASLAGNLCGFAFTFLTNTFLNFKKSDKLFSRFVSYGLICLVGTAVSTLIIWLFKEFINEYLLKAMAMVIVCLLQFILNKCITYKN